MMEISSLNPKLLFFVINLSEEEVIGERVPYKKAIIKLYKSNKKNKPIIFSGLKSKHIII